MTYEGREDGRSDGELVVALRSGDQSASEELFRRHQAPALAFAVRAAGRAQADDLVSEAFQRIFSLVRRGDGPSGAFRPYLLTTIRHIHVDSLRRTSKEVAYGDLYDVAAATGHGGPRTDDGIDDRFDVETLLAAYRSLPERWQAVLWYTTVENRSHKEAAEQLGTSPNSVAVMAFRAREGLRQAYLAEHLSRTEDPACRRIAELLPRYVRNDLSAAQTRSVASHLATCASCAAATAELAAINKSLGALLVPAVLGVGLSRREFRYFGAPASRLARRLALLLPLSAGVAVLALVLVLRGDSAPADQVRAADVTTEPLSAVPRATPPVATTSPVRPTPSPRPAHPARSASAVVSPTPTRAASPVVTFGLPPARPSSPPRRFPIVDAALGRPEVEVLHASAPVEYHVAVPVSGRGADLGLQVVLTDVTQLHVHQDHLYGAWQCRDAGSTTGPDRTLTCSLANDPGRSQDFAVDVAGTGAPIRISAAVSVGGGRDPRKVNNTTSVTVG